MTKKTVILLCLALAVIVAVSAAQDPQRCFVCGKKIKGAYIEYEGKVVCAQSCLGALLPKCATCAKPVSAGKGLKGEYLKHNGRYYCCQECFEQSLPKCGTCGNPVKGGLKADDGKMYCCRECYRQTLPKCDICKKPMEAWTDYEGHRFCKECAQLPRCLGCCLPGADVSLDDGRTICSKCLPGAVTDSVKARRLFEEVRNDIRDKLGLETDHRIDFSLVDARELSRVIKQKAVHESGFYHYRGKVDQSTGRTVSAEYHIYLLSHLPKARFRDVAAHELAHDIGQARYPKVSGATQKRSVEGFAEYISALMNKHWGQDKLNQDKLNNKDPDYTAGFLKFMELDKQGGLRAALAHMEKLNKGTGKSRTGK